MAATKGPFGKGALRTTEYGNQMARTLASGHSTTQATLLVSPRRAAGAMGQVPVAWV
ncbi:hypothetical protein [Candidatus Spongiisocius sp.]|uniref:hypothetical protein n=1 Tax=Candidatus Spongiisocius sp. TaxID=3101273 RepID=UPI003B59EDAE